MAIGEDLKARIEALREASPELKGVLLASSDGLPIAHSLPNGLDPNRIAALAAIAYGTGRRITLSLGDGAWGEVTIRTQEGALFLYSAGTSAVLAISCIAGGNDGLIHLEARTAAKEIGDLL